MVGKLDTILLHCAAESPTTDDDGPGSGGQNKELSNLVGVDRAERERKTDSVQRSSPTTHLVMFLSLLRSRNGSIDKEGANSLEKVRQPDYLIPTNV